MWEVDPETKSKLLTLQKQPANAQCADCSNPAPQWASPKFGTFICLDCAGTHRGLGVHVSFVRSVLMDSFKVAEVKRMEAGGNEAWRTFWNSHAAGGAAPGGDTTWTQVHAERYSGDVGEEYKERLAAKVEGRDYVPIPKKERPRPNPAAARAMGGGSMGSRTNSPSGRGSSTSRGQSPAAAAGGRKERNEAYFARMGAENANRSEDLPPSQGGKYGGFGGGVPVAAAGSGASGNGIPSANEFQKDPVAALTKGFGWFTTTVSKNAKSVNEGWIQPGVQKLSETDFAAQARQTAATVATGVTRGTQNATDSFNRFVEGGEGHGRSTVEPERKDFWDSFAAAGASASGGSGSNGNGIGNDARGGLGHSEFASMANEHSSSHDRLGEDDTSAKGSNEALLSASTAGSARARPSRDSASTSPAVGSAAMGTEKNGSEARKESNAVAGDEGNQEWGDDKW